MYRLNNRLANQVIQYGISIQLYLIYIVEYKA
jgi:hypothetical protein